MSVMLSPRGAGKLSLGSILVLACLSGARVDAAWASSAGVKILPTVEARLLPLGYEAPLPAFAPAPAPVRLAQADIVTVAVTARTEGAEVVLHWPSPVRVMPAIDGREVLLRFDRPLDAPDLADLPQQLPQWIESTSLGYDSALLRTAREARFEVTASGQNVVIRIFPATAPVEASSETDGARLRLALLQARLLVETRRFDEARALLHQLADRYPADIDLLAAQAGLEERSRNRREALRLYDQALTIAPDNADIKAARKALLRGGGGGPQIRPEAEYLKIHEAERVITLGVTGEALPIGPGADAGFHVEQKTLHSKSLRRADGSSDAFHGERQRGDAWLGKEWSDALRTQLTLHGGPGTAGFTIDQAWRGLDQEAHLQATWHQPYWGMLEGMLSQARVSHYLARYQATPDPRVTFGGSLGVSRYGISTDSSVATSSTASADLRFVPWEQRPGLSLGYGIEAEFFRQRDHRIAPDGTTYVPLNLHSRDYHRLDIAWTEELAPSFRAGLVGGYAIDFLAQPGPFVGTEMTYAPDGDFDAGLRIGRNWMTSPGASGIATTIAGTVTWRF